MRESEDGFLLKAAPPLSTDITSSQRVDSLVAPARHTRIVVNHYGGPDALRVVEDERPEPQRGEVRVRVLAAGVS